MSKRKKKVTGTGFGHPRQHRPKTLSNSKVIRLENVRLGGFALTNSLPGEEVDVLSRAAITSNDRDFYVYMEGISNLIISKAQEKGLFISLDSITDFVLVIHENETADLYLNDVPTAVEILAKRDLQAGEAVSAMDIADIRRVKFENILFNTSDKVVACFKIGWKFGLFFDLTPNSQLDVEQMELDIGLLHKGLRFQYLYEILSDPKTLERLISAGWFPFIEIISEINPLLKAFNYEFDIEGQEQALIKKFDKKRIEKISERWWKKPIIYKHKEVLEAGLHAFSRGDYISCIKNISTEIEGVLVDLHLTEKGSIPGTKERLQYATSKGVQKSGGTASLLFPEEFLEYLNDVIFAQFNPLNPQGAGVSRHAVGHGRASGDSYTSSRALQYILTLDQIVFYL